MLVLGINDLATPKIYSHIKIKVRTWEAKTARYQMQGIKATGKGRIMVLSTKKESEYELPTKGEPNLEVDIAKVVPNIYSCAKEDNVPFQTPR